MNELSMIVVYLRKKCGIISHKFFSWSLLVASEEKANVLDTWEVKFN